MKRNRQENPDLDNKVNINEKRNIFVMNLFHLIFMMKKLIQCLILEKTLLKNTKNRKKSI